MDITLRDVDEAVVKTVTHICKNPLIFVSETDIHMLLAFHLMQISGLSPTDLYKTACTIGRRDSNVSSKSTYLTGLLHKEYGVHGMPKSRIDLVILGKGNVGKINDPLNLKTDSRWMQPEFAFEFGTEKAASSDSVFGKHLSNDIKKLSCAHIRGYLIHIHRNYCQSTGDRLADNREKYMKYERKLSNAINGLAAHQRSVIRIIAAKIEIGSNGRKIGREGKIKLFLHGKFKGINQNNIRSTITDILK